VIPARAPERTFRIPLAERGTRPETTGTRTSLPRHFCENENVSTYDLETLLLTAAKERVITSQENAQVILQRIEEKDFYTFNRSFKDQIRTAFENDE
jgi:hypothetical protein